MPVSRRNVLSLLAAAPVLAACGVGGSSGSQASRTVRIAYQNFADSTLLLKDQRTLETALPGHTITWTAFDSGASINTAFLGKSIDLAVIGSSPAAAGLCPPLTIPYRVIELLNVIGDSEALVVRKATGITRIADLTGRKVAAPFGSTAHYSLLAALQQAGVDPGTVTLIDLEPQNIQAAWQRGDIDGAYVWTPVLSVLQRDAVTLTDSAKLASAGKPTLTFTVAGKEFADNNPDVLGKWLTATNGAIKQIKSDPAVVAAAVSRQIGSSTDDALTQLKQNIYLDHEQQRAPEYFGTPQAPGKLALQLRATAEFLAQQKKVESVPDVAAFQAALRVPGA
ncbi:glycine betaine ABC transporter substrate-binding protein [Kibdelosporangium phytohabitans]|uniref:Glycine/betaine ABC transporter substrate-binding protein n=1 Tax=Kibdelosporangium phytohabitans TaxID=860235 RepID=A0A0N9I716_9PSEU|nr:glycine betaine ABC transporter substrate-binding protein [Kibdelosporangium phytohabitans]ALG10705.1 glycine/betaine ABC transporter substrate-binding protein [Kibdelosporangium phytohabitans]MBE1461839.1 taurine transport system substrate-binding protein [Kibdelosporangium phytohabitans]